VARQRAEAALRLVGAEDRHAAAQPAMLNAFEAAVSVIVRASISRESEANGTCRWPGVDEVLVDLVGDDPPVALERERGERLELVAAERAAGRVVRIAEQEDPRARVGLASQAARDRIADRARQRERILVEPAPLLRDRAEKGG
jgi:hypothetical protein